MTVLPDEAIPRGGHAGHPSSAESHQAVAADADPEVGMPVGEDRCDVLVRLRKRHGVKLSVGQSRETGGGANPETTIAVLGEGGNRGAGKSVSSA